MRVSKAALWLSGGTLVVALLGLVPGYLVFFDKSDLVYETLVENIPLPKDLPGQLPDSLAIVTVQNVGRRPSTDLQGSMTVGGDLIEYQVQGPNPAFGQVSHSRNGSQILFSCPRLASGDYPIKVSAWYKGAGSSPDVGVSDARGAARGVKSIGAETAKYWGLGSGVAGLLVGLLGSFAVIGNTYRTYEIRKSISAAAREIAATPERVNLAAGEAGNDEGQAPEREK